MIAQAIANTAVGVTEALKQSGPLGIALGVLVAAAGAIEIATIQAQEFATGGQFVTNGPEMIKVGDNPSGRELVEITPLGGDPNINGPQGRGITLNISAPLVDETVVESILPALEKANRMNLA